jgi:sterol desaturase/sphingolipid hydroxylase (fatty acid hydroxylase superfamily)
LSWDWAGLIYLRNFITLGLVASGLHYYFFHRRAQQTELKYLAQFLHRKSPRFLFNNQLYDNIFHTMVSGALIWSGYEVLMFWGMGNGYVTVISFSDHPIWTLIALPLISMWGSLHFYFIHRLMHLKPVYDHVHALHHRNVNIGPFSGISMHPVEHLLYFSSLLIHFVVPTHPLHIIFHLYMLGLAAVFSHTGFDALLIKNKRRLGLGHFHHQLHHRYFGYNYGTIDMPWDVVFGTFHDGTAEMSKKIDQKERQKSTP